MYIVGRALACGALEIGAQFPAESNQRLKNRFPHGAQD